MEQPTLDTLLQEGPFSDRYQIIKLIGTGGMGNVYLANDIFLDKEKIALKILHLELCKEEKQVARFLREVQLTRKVTHPNVVRTFDIGKCEGRLFFTMEYAEGQNLHELFTETPCPFEMAAQIMLEVLRGLAAIHEAGIIHRDLKPNNIMITTAGLLKIMDFGIARPFCSDLTSQHEIVGSAPYMAPEVWVGRDVGCQADLYSLAIMIYELITGTVPFEADTAAEMMCKHLESRAVSPDVLVPELPIWFTEIIMRQLRKTSCDRAASAQELAGIIEGQLGAVGSQIDFNQQQLRSQTLVPPQSVLSQYDFPEHIIPQVMTDRPITNDDGLPPEPSLTNFGWKNTTLDEVEEVNPAQNPISQAYSQQYSTSLSSLTALSSVDLRYQAKNIWRSIFKRVTTALLFSAAVLVLFVSIYHLSLSEIVFDMAKEGTLGLILATAINIFWGSLIVAVSHLVISSINFSLQRNFITWFGNATKLVILVGLMSVISMVQLELASSKLVPSYSITNINRIIGRNVETVWRSALLIPPSYSGNQVEAVKNSHRQKVDKNPAANKYEYLISFFLFWIILHNLIFIDLLKRGSFATLILSFAFFAPLLLLQSSLEELYGGSVDLLSLSIVNYQISLSSISAVSALGNWLLILGLIALGLFSYHRGKY